MADPTPQDPIHASRVSDRPTIPYIEGDGIGQDIWPAAKLVFDAAVKAAFGSKKKVAWLEVAAGEKGFARTGEWLPDETLNAIKTHGVAIKGPLTTPVGKGMRSLNVRIRQQLDLYACIRPIRYYPPVPSPVSHPERVDMVVFRENTEDLYAGIEWDSGSWEVTKLLGLLKSELNCDLPASCSIGIKPMSPEKTKRLVIRAFEYAFENNRKSVTLMHKGNIMKFTEGGFRKWGYEAAFETFGDRVITEETLFETHEGILPDGLVVIKDRIADMVFAEVLLRPENFDIIACPNLNGDYISDALAAQVGGLGIAPGANIGDSCAVFEATHGTAPDIAGKDLANPCSLILSGAMMFDHMGWQRAGNLIRDGVAKALAQGRVTRDLASRIKGGEEVTCSRFSRIIAEQILSGQ
ncbi:MAG: NADP-dependent isocitrate dehydrogenase [Proteobacteria bacterium]|nr:NADP-dependent isocitrate dehydrogenase [Desulfobacula sp.]MBU4130047.1 NADP-dependent isocitrate dehydrogenase [Pseudomonadota bacterium]